MLKVCTNIFLTLGLSCLVKNFMRCNETHNRLRDLCDLSSYQIFCKGVSFIYCYVGIFYRCQCFLV